MVIQLVSARVLAKELPVSSTAQYGPLEYLKLCVLRISNVPEGQFLRGCISEPITVLTEAFILVTHHRQGRGTLVFIKRLKCNV